ncbi:hypothetical protein HDE_13591 [Halotydeus destructor]|nr:hypothetical protein HDE_13591 [Halotydeus destructor]
MFENKTQFLSLDLDSIKPKLKLEVSNLFSGKLIKSIDNEESFYSEPFEYRDDDEEVLAERAADFFSLPTPDVMKVFAGQNLNLPKPGTPTVEANNFAEGTLVNFSQNKSAELDFGLLLDSQNPTPQPQFTGSLETPVVDPNRSERHPLSGHLTGVAPATNLQPDSLICDEAEVQNNQASSHVAESQQAVYNNEPVVATHYIYEDSTNYDENLLSSSTSSFTAPMISYVEPIPTASSSSATFTELQPRTSTCLTTASDHLMPTVIQDHIYSIHSPSTSQYNACSPAPSTTSHESSADSKDFIRFSGTGTKRRGSSLSEGSSKKPRLTKRQQFLELQTREKNLAEENIFLKDKEQSLKASVEKMKKMLFEKMGASQRV